MEDEGRKKKKTKPAVVGVTRRHEISSSSSPTAPPPSLPPLADSNINESEGGDHIAEIKRKKGKKPKPLKWRSTNSDMNNRSGEAEEEEGSDGDRDDETVLSSLTRATTSCSTLISSKRVRPLGKVAEDCDAVDPPVPRKLRSAIHKRVGQNVPSSPRHAKKRRHLSAISAQIFLMDSETRTDETRSSNSFTKEEEVLADTLLALSQIPASSEPTADKATEQDISNKNVASTSCPEGAIKEDDKISSLPIDANKVVTQPACADQQVEPTGCVPQIKPALAAPHNSINPHLPKDGKIQDLSLGLFANSPSAPKEPLNKSAWKKPKAQFDGSLSLTNPPKEAPHWLLNRNKSGFTVHDRKKDENNSAKEVIPFIQAPLPCASTGSSKKPSSSVLDACTISATETTTSWATKSNEKLSLPENGGPAKIWKKSVTHAYVSHLIQNHLDKEKASQNQTNAQEKRSQNQANAQERRSQNQANAQERSHSRISSSPSGSNLNRNGVHFDARLPVQPSMGVCDTAAGRQTMVSTDFLNMPTSAAFSGPQYVQYIHPQMITTHRGAAPYPSYSHLPCSRGNVAPTMTVQQQMQQYICNPGYAPHPGVPASQAGMKLQQFAPTPQQHQQQQMWQYHFSQYQPRPAEGSAAAWQNGRLLDMPSSGSMRPMQALLPAPAMAPPPPPQMELLCAPYQGSGGGGRRPPQLRLI